MSEENEIKENLFKYIRGSLPENVYNLLCKKSVSWGKWELGTDPQGKVLVNIYPVLWHLATPGQKSF